MNTTFEVAVEGVGLFMKDYPTASAWAERQPAEEPQAPKGAQLDRRSRGRSSVLTKALADAFFEAVDQAGLDPSEVSAVFGSALGELGTMLGLLNQMWRDQEDPSPMGFALSVHNAASGVVSIAKKNHGFTTSLGADHDTPAMALMEAIGIIATTGKPVIVVCGDEPTPGTLVSEDESWELATAAIALVPSAAGSDESPRLVGPLVGASTLSGTEASPKLARNPQIGLIDLVHAIQSREPGLLALDRGRGSGWCVEIRVPHG